MGYKRKTQTGRRKANKDAERRRHGAASTRPLRPRNGGGTMDPGDVEGTDATE